MISSCILSIHENVPNPKITVVDNNSMDGTIENLKLKFPYVEIIQNSKNLGFGTACNIGSKGSDCQYLVFINQDATIEEFPRGDIIQFFEEKSYSILGGKVLLQGSGISPCVGLKVTPFRTLMYWASMPVRILGLGWFDLLKVPRTEEICQARWIPGSLMVFRTSDFNSLGGFNESFFMYVEDVEICHRARSEGMGTAYFPTIVSSHSSRGGRGVSRVAVHHTLKNQKEFLRQRHGNIIPNVCILFSSIFCVVYGLLGSFLLFPFARMRKSSLNLLMGGFDYMALISRSKTTFLGDK